MPVCTSSKISSRPWSSQSWRNALKKACGASRTPPSPCSGSIRMPAVCGPTAFLTASRSPSGTWSKPSIGGPKPSRYFAEPVALRVALGGVIFARDFNGAFHRLGAGIGEEHEIGKALFAQPCRQPLAVRALEQVRHVPEFGGLFLQRCD